jgi:drug/metabolite transporter (DMT)-like permease
MFDSPLFLRLSPAFFVFLWSSGWIVAGYSARYSDALTFLSVRFACAGLALSILAVALGAQWPKTRRAISAASGGRCVMACRPASPA